MAARSSLRFASPALRELRLHLSQSSEASRGVREFIEARFVTLKTENPNLPVLVRECRDVPARLWARYAYGQERSVLLDNLSAEQVTKEVEALANAKV
ncbi:NADH dehydrogenase [ubiquinone] 1 alpha subcomplex subunit 2 [Petromyzon marinus]|uniref:NADH dehydrogenase [ubiquinone] 1 alpha subcomplex subunit 2 n=1 Tax=Petromyzon marinus TaxID=7757 RepID=S4RM46_PETMA|nr:NADH dehydrogenase [ubiquinone] 1 alpha subcomplex subunit 2 [Petromyzon marinus]XP_061405428.1 NADH dehydrogenase [ubiquinone] 1 alpha subcomplex subunit 2 [Lethenteron reissneri]